MPIIRVSPLWHLLQIGAFRNEMREKRDTNGNLIAIPRKQDLPSLSFWNVAWEKDPNAGLVGISDDFYVFSTKDGRLEVPKS